MAVLPDDSQFRPLRGFNDNNGLEFGRNFSANSFVYIGGLPSFYSTKLSSLALPSAVFEPRFRGSIRNIVYADDETGRPRRQEVMAYKVSFLFLRFFFCLEMMLRVPKVFVLTMVYRVTQG